MTTWRIRGQFDFWGLKSVTFLSRVYPFLFWQMEKELYLMQKKKQVYNIYLTIQMHHLKSQCHLLKHPPIPFFWLVLLFPQEQLLANTPLLGINENQPTSQRWPTKVPEVFNVRSEAIARPEFFQLRTQRRATRHPGGGYTLEEHPVYPRNLQHTQARQSPGNANDERNPLIPCW